VFFVGSLQHSWLKFKRFRDKLLAFLKSRQFLRTMHILWIVSVLLDFWCSLAIDASGTANCSSNITHGASINSILFTSFSTQQEQGNAWCNETGQATKYSRLVQILSITIDQTWGTEGSTHACFTVIHTPTHSLFPFSRHDFDEIFSGGLKFSDGSLA